jgi:hypothetical protein
MQLSELNWRTMALLASLLLVAFLLHWWLIESQRAEVQPPANTETLAALGDEALRKQVFGDLHACIVWQGYGWSGQNEAIRNVYAVMIAETARDHGLLVQWLPSAKDPDADAIGAAYAAIGNTAAAEAVRRLAAHLGDLPKPVADAEPPPANPQMDAATSQLITAYRSASGSAEAQATLTAYIRSQLAELTRR